MHFKVLHNDKIACFLDLANWQSWIIKAWTVKIKYHEYISKKQKFHCKRRKVYLGSLHKVDMTRSPNLKKKNMP